MWVTGRVPRSPRAVTPGLPVSNGIESCSCFAAYFSTSLNISLARLEVRTSSQVLSPPGLGGSSAQETKDRQQHRCADRAHDQTRGISLPIPAISFSEISGQQRTCQTHHYRGH